MSTRKLRPMVQPDSANACKNASHAGLRFRIVGGIWHEHADMPHPLRLLRAPQAAKQSASLPRRRAGR